MDFHIQLENYRMNFIAKLKLITKINTNIKKHKFNL